MRYMSTLESARRICCGHQGHWLLHRTMGVALKCGFSVVGFSVCTHPPASVCAHFNPFDTPAGDSNCLSCDISLQLTHGDQGKCADR